MHMKSTCPKQTQPLRTQQNYTSFRRLALGLALGPQWFALGPEAFVGIGDANHLHWGVT